MEELLNKFNSKIKINSITQCHIWLGSKNRKGYGHFKVGTVNNMAHRWIWQQHKGDIPKGMLVCHICDNPSCVNILHLWLGTHQDNMRDRNLKGRQARGERSGVNTKPDTRQYGEKCVRAKLTWKDIDDIRDKALHISQRQIAREYNLSPSQVNKIVKGIQWKESVRHISDLKD